MTVAPELPPVSTARPGGARRLRAVRVDRTPAGVVALVEPPRPHRGVVAPVPLVAPAPPVEPGVGREHRPTDPTPARGRTVRPAAPTAPVRPVGRRMVGARVVRPAPGHLRLTRRGRLVTFAATLLIAGLTLVGVVSRAGSLVETAPVPASAPAQVVVAPGETLWSIAQRVAPDRDPRTVVAGIQHLNDLPTADVHAGQTLILRRP
jgi:hypothetical protein